MQRTRICFRLLIPLLLLHAPAWALQIPKRELAGELAKATELFTGRITAAQCLEQAPGDVACSKLAYVVMSDGKRISLTSHQSVDVGTEAIFVVRTPDRQDTIVLAVETTPRSITATSKLVYEKWVILPGYGLQGIQHMQVPADNCALAKEGSFIVGPNVCRFEAAMLEDDFWILVKTLQKEGWDPPPPE